MRLLIAAELLEKKLNQKKYIIYFQDLGSSAKKAIKSLHYGKYLFIDILILKGILTSLKKLQGYMAIKIFLKKGNLYMLSINLYFKLTV